MLKISNIVYLTIVFFLMKYFKLFNVINKTTKVKDKTYSMGAIFGSLILGAYLLEKAINELLYHYPSLPRLPSFMYDNLEGHSLFNETGDGWSGDQPTLYVPERDGSEITLQNSCLASTDPEQGGAGICPPYVAPNFINPLDENGNRIAYEYTETDDATLEDGTTLCCHPRQVQGFLLQRLKPYHEIGRDTNPGEIDASVDDFPQALRPLYYPDADARDGGPENAIEVVPSVELMNRYRDPDDERYIPLPGVLPDEAYIYCPPGNVCQEDPDNRLTPFGCYNGDTLTGDTYEDCVGEWRQGTLFSWDNTGPQQLDANDQDLGAGYEVDYLRGNQQGEPLAGNTTHVANLGLDAGTLNFTHDQIRWYSNHRNQGPTPEAGVRLYSNLEEWLQSPTPGSEEVAITCRNCNDCGPGNTPLDGCESTIDPLVVQYIRDEAAAGNIGSAREANLIATSYCNYPPEGHGRCAGPDYTNEEISTNLGIPGLDQSAHEGVIDNSSSR